MKKINITIVGLLCCLSMMAQTISVSSFILLDTDLTANTAGTMALDQNGETAALIKVVTTQTGFTFDGGSLGIVKTTQKPGEIWVYVPKGLKKITISHPQLGVLRDYYFNIPIEAARTYEMVLVSGDVQTVVKEVNQSQYIVFKVSPNNAVVIFNNEILPIKGGIAQKFVRLGTYEYRIQAQDYHTTAGKVTINDPKAKKVLEINLKPAFGWIEIEDTPDLNGAQVFVDNTYVGDAPLKTNRLPSGTHNVKIAKELYLNYEETVEVKDDIITQIEPKLIADYVNVTIKVEGNAGIYINNILKGNGIWNGKLGKGTYELEARKPNYKKTTKQLDIDTSDISQKEQIIILNEPTPIFGEMKVNCDPFDSDVYIDGIEYGQTPLYIPEILTGDHMILIKKKGYPDYKSKITVKEGQVCEIDATLIFSYNMITFKCNVQSPRLFLNGVDMGIINGPIKVKSGYHTIKITKQGYEDYVDYVTVTPEKTVFDIEMIRNH